MTIEVLQKLGYDIYQTLVRGLMFAHGAWLHQDEIPGKRGPVTLITSEGIDQLKGWTSADLDDLSGIGPAKAKKIHDILRQE